MCQLVSTAKHKIAVNHSLEDNMEKVHVVSTVSVQMSCDLSQKLVTEQRLSLLALWSLSAHQ